MALTGFLAGNACHATWWDANLAYFRSINPVILSNGSTVSYEQDATGAFQITTVSASGVKSFVAAPSPTFQMCDPMQGFNDGLSLAAIVVTASALAIFWGILSKAR